MKPARLVAYALAALAAAMLIACSSGGDDDSDATSTPENGATPRITASATVGTPGPSVTPGPGGTPAVTATPGGSGGGNNANGGGGNGANVPADADDAVQAAKRDIVENIFEGRTVDEITVVSVTPQQWPDACLGAPEGGEACAQVITPGFIVVLDLEGAHYTYHTDEGTTVRLASFDLDPSSTPGA
jgi:hypothetical protein